MDAVSDLATVAPDSALGSNAPGLPPIEVPTIERRPPLRITVTPDRSDPYAGYSEAPPTAPAAQAEPYAAYSDKPPEPKPQREIGRGESALRGGLDMVAMGAAPVVSGIREAGMADVPDDVREAISRHGHEPVLGALIAGLGRLGYEHLIAPALGLDTEKRGTEAYRKERDRLQEEQTSAEEQNPGSYLAGQLAGTVATPAFGAIKGATALGRVAHAAKSGAASGALYGAGEGASKGQNPVEVGENAAKGAVTGAVFGGAGSAALEAGKGLVGRAKNVIHGAYDPDTVAAQTILSTMKGDVEKHGLGMNDEVYAAAQKAGMPVHLIDLGGQGTRDLARAAGNMSPQAWDALHHATSERAEGRSARIHGALNALFGGSLDAKLDQEAIKARARIVNRPRYASAYRMGDRPIWSPEMERLSASPAVQAAIKSAVTSGKDKAIKDGFGAFNPGVKVTQDGRLELGRGPSGVPTYPNIQFWDYVQRDLKDMATKVEGRENDKAATLNGLHHDLNAELDRLVPEFRNARQGAAGFFRAEDASEAGRKFVMMTADPREERRALAAFSAPDRELFARGFADELAQRVLGSGSMGTLKRAFTTPLARQKIETALGATRAREVEALITAELAAHQSLQALGNSTTTKQQEFVRALKGIGGAGGHGAMGAGAIGAFELVKDAEYDPEDLVAALVVGGMIKAGAHKVDTRVARRIGEMLTSRDPSILRRGAQIVARSPQLFNALRNGTEAGARISAHDIGLDKSLAGVAALLEKIKAKREAHHQHAPDDQNVTQPVPQ